MVRNAGLNLCKGRTGPGSAPARSGLTLVPKHVDRILRGAKPADLPVQFPPKFERAVNLKTAKALGLAVPPSIRPRATEVIANLVILQGTSGFNLSSHKRRNSGSASFSRLVSCSNKARLLRSLATSGWSGP